MIGNIEDAAEALRDYNNNAYENVFSANGTTRMVYLINDVIYKVDCGTGYFSDNRAEYDNIMANSNNLPEGVYFPDTALFEIDGKNIIAMEYIEGEPMSECYCDEFEEEHTSSCLPDDIRDLVSPIIDDTGGENVILTDDGRIYIIDAAC